MDLDLQSALELVRQCRENKFWGSVSFNLQDGKIVFVELKQTIKQIMPGAEVPILVLNLQK